MRSENGAGLQMRHEAFSRLCVALIPIDRAGSTRRVKNSENRDFARAAGFPQKINRCSRYLETKFVTREKMRLYSQAADLGCPLAPCGKGVVVALL
jgi:hypothetical protein